MAQSKDGFGPRRNRSSLLVGLAIAVLVAIGAGLFVATRRSNSLRAPARPSAKGPERPEGLERPAVRPAGAPAQKAGPLASREASPTPLPAEESEPDATPTLELEGPYEDALQAQIDFGRHSYYLTPWRAYMDSWPARRFLECIGFTLNCEPAEAEAVAEVIAAAGARSARVEVGWGNFRYEDPSRLHENAEKSLFTTLRALKKHGIRPLILLNAHHGVPCPVKWFDVNLTREAPQGAHEIYVDRLDEIRPGYTGLTNLTDYLAAFPMITKVDAASRRCELSAPLPKALPAGKLTLSLLRYQPFSGEVFADGRPNPASRETLEGWMTYVKAICRYAKEALGTEGASDAGFDLEVWNEYTFGSNFLDINHYYNPPLSFKEPITYSRHGRTAKGSEAILPMTVDYVNDPANRLGGVNVISGFSNQRPWDNGTEMWPGQAGFSRHYYTGVNLKDYSPENPKSRNSGPLNALGKPDGTPDGKDWHTVIPGSFFVPVVNVSMPEYWHYGYQTEFMTRDIQPFPSTSGGPVSFAHHHRYSHPGTGRPAQVWMTETNFDRGPWADELSRNAGCRMDDPRLVALLHHVAAKATLRYFTMYSHKGVHTITMFAVKCADRDLAVIPEAFFKALKEDGYKLTDRVRSLRGAQLQVLERAVRIMRDSKPIETARPLKVERLVERQVRIVFKGDGTPEHPDRTHKDDFACLPFQLDESRFAIAYYVVTRNMVKAWDEKKDILDPARYDMPEQEFDLTLSNIRGEGAIVSVYDPFRDREVPVKTLRGTANTLAVRLKAVDYPRFLLLKEARPGPLILGPCLRRVAPDRVELSFESNVASEATVTAGPFPLRRPVDLEGDWRPGHLLGEYYSGKNFERLLMRRMDPCVDFDWNVFAPKPSLPRENISVRWTGRLEPELDGVYSFHTAADDGTRLWVDGRLVIDDWNYHGVEEKTARVELVAGRKVPIKLEYFQGGGGASVRLMWTPPGRAKEVIPPARFSPPERLPGEEGGLRRTMRAEAGKRCKLELPFGNDLAVRIELRGEGLTARWPIWDWDVQGVMAFSGEASRAGPEIRSGGYRLPELPGARRASSWGLVRTSGVDWQDVGEGFAARTASSLSARVRLVKGGLEPALKLLPTLSVSDSYEASAVTLGGFEAWRIDVRLDPVAHPGASELVHRFYIVPVGDGMLVLSMAAPKEMPDMEAERLAAAIRFE